METKMQELTFESFQDSLSEILQIEKTVITKEANIYQEIGIDSLGLVNLGGKIQKKYEIDIPPAVIVEVRTVGDFYEEVKKLVK